MTQNCSRTKPWLILALVIATPGTAQTLMPGGSIFQSGAWIERLYEADFNGDGVDEILAEDVAFVASALRVWKPDSSGSWTSTRVGNVSFFRNPVIADFDGDGRADIALIDDPLFDGRLYIFFSRPGAVPFVRVQISPTVFGQNSRLAAPDYDGDGDPDLVAADGSQFAVFRNDGTTQFTELPSTPPRVIQRSFVPLDIDQDGLDDLIARGSTPQIGWMRSLGDGRFDPMQPLMTSPVPNVWRLQTRDVDQDGDFDIVCTEATNASSFGSRTSFWLQVGPGPTAVLRTDHLTVPGAQEMIADVRDLDLDGRTDLLTHESSGGQLLFHPGLGAGNFGTPVVLPAQLIRAAIGTDVDRDGDLDILMGGRDWYENVAFVSSMVCAGQPSSAGPGANLVATGSRLVMLDRTTLVGSDMPPGSFGLFLTSLQVSAPVPITGSQGELCLGGPIGRFNRPGEIGAADGAGILRHRLDLTDIPDAVLGSVLVVGPETRFFQLWYRDSLGGVSTSNLSAAAAVDFR